ncbi:MAG TPA: hypothetical protein PLG79_08965 [Spirochaetales bacterium]|nr:hypothetical protein [Spirochaetales bacterium]HOV38839.1 hypothetical protein [Spirochaetales bacterium]
MGKISVEAKRRYFEKVKEYKTILEQFIQREKNLLKVVEKGDSNAAYVKINLAEESLNLASYYLLLNEISLSLLAVKNDSFLNEARKSCYKSIIYLEDVVSNCIDTPYSDYKEKLELIEGMQDEKRYALVQKLGFTIQSVIDAFGEQSKWKWSFVELEGRFATVAKNIFNMKNLAEGLDPRSEGYQFRTSHLNLLKDLLQKAADRYREKYELSTLRIDDFKLAISYLGALRRLYLLLGDGPNAETIRKKIEVWTQKMADDERRLDSRRTPGTKPPLEHHAH